jgi:nucleotide-binding universal stress UspA family protein
MSFKTILSIVGVDERDSDLIAAAELCQRIGAHLNALVVASVPPAPYGDITGAAYSTWSMAWEEENKRVEARTSELRGLLSQKDMPGDVQPIYCLQGSIDDEIAERARYADVSLIGSELIKDEFLFHRVLDGALFQSPGPVMLAPKGKAVDLAPKTVLLAWNSSLEAGKAARHAMEMLVRADSVHIVLVDPQATSDAMGQEPGADIATYLARQGVKATVDVVASSGREISDVLRQQAADINADLIVMGGYGHSRMREWIFGGVTKSMIENPPVPVLLAH